MSSISVAFNRLSVASQKIGFWEEQLEYAIKRVEFRMVLKLNNFQKISRKQNLKYQIF